MDGEIRATCNLAEKRQERKCGKGLRERVPTIRVAEENWRNYGNTGSFEHRRRRVTFVLDYFFVSGEGE
jgi:hypothetical protein